MGLLKVILVVFGIMVVLIFSIFLIFNVSIDNGETSIQKPKAGDCVDVSEYDQSRITKYCRVSGNVGIIGGTEEAPKYHLNIDSSSCDVECFDYIDENGNKVNLRRCPLTGANTIDGKIVSNSLCAGVGK